MQFFTPDIKYIEDLESRLDISKIYSAVNDYIPIGIPDTSRYSPKFKPGTKIPHFFNQPRSRKLEKLLGEPAKTRDRFNEFQSYCNKVGERIGKEVTGSVGLWPGLFATLQLKHDLEPLYYSVKLQFFISLIGPFYTVLLETRAGVTERNAIEFQFSPFYTISPIGKFADYITMLRDILEEDYPDHSFVPFDILRTKIRGLFVPYSENEWGDDCCIFQALFFQGVDISKVQFIGDLEYGKEAWTKLEVPSED